jgi:hypothetical protein
MKKKVNNNLFNLSFLLKTLNFYFPPYKIKQKLLHKLSKIIKVENAAPQGSVEEQIYNLLDRLEGALEENIKRFEEAEIASGWNLAVWFQDTEAELEYFVDEVVRANEYIDKMNIALQAAKATENKAWEIYFQSSSNYHNAITICRHKGEDYLADKHQRDDEIALLDDVIKQFRDQSGTLL